MSLRAEDLKGQRQGLTEEDGSGGEAEAEAALARSPEDGTGKVAIKVHKKTDIAILPCVMITGLLVTFGALALTVLFFVTAAFDPEQLPTLSNSSHTQG